MFRCLVIFSIFLIIDGKRLSPNNTAVLISKYAKVARFNSKDNNTAQETGRSHAAQSIWTPRSSSNTNSAVKNQVVYQYPVYKKIDEEEKVEKIPGIGEVIQDRFQVRPYFGYKAQKPDLSYLPPSKPADSTPTKQAAPPPSSTVSFPAAQPSIASSAINTVNPPAMFNTPASSTTVKAPASLYDSPFNSYNPPPFKNTDSSQDAYPPISSDSNSNDDSSSSNSYADAPQSNGGIYDYPKAPKQAPPPSSDYANSGGFMPSNKPSSMASHSHDDSRPKHPPKSIDDVYYPPDFPADQIPSHNHDHDMDDHGMTMDNHGMPVDNTDMSMEQSPPDNHDMTMDLVPPVDGHDFPKYLYDDHHYDHHVYEEVHHTTTPAPEQKRVSSTNYSYYYLGRKLWYIPLYFSIYFMVYVTALIIKSIARHKVTFRNEWISAHSRSARSLAFDQLDAVDDIHNKVSYALDKAGKLYSDISM